NVANATVGVSIDAGALTAQSALDVTLGRGANFLSLGAGADRVVLLGNYVAGTYNVTENGVNLNTQSTATAVARVVTDTINLGNGNDTLVTYGAINLAGAILSNIESISANSALVITASEYNALVAARNALSLSTPVITFIGNTPHQLTIIDDVGGINNIDLSLIAITGGNLVFDVTSASNATGGGVNNMTTSNAITTSGGATAIAGIVGTSPTNGGGIALNPTVLTAGGVFNGVAGINENFTGTAATLAGTTVNGNAGDTDAITLSGAVNIVLNDGGAGGSISNIKTLNLSNFAVNAINFTNATSGVTTINGGNATDTVNLTNSGSSLLAGNINLGVGNNLLILEGKTYTGTFSSGSGVTDQLTMFNGTNIAPANVTGFENLLIAPNASVTMTAAQYSSFTGTITGTGTETITYTTAGNIVGTANVENYVLANGSNTFGMGSNTLVSVTGGTGADTFNLSTAVINAAANAGINGGLGADTLLAGVLAGGSIDFSVKVTAIETINIVASTTAAWTIKNEDGVGFTMNLFKDAGGADLNNVTLGSGGQTLNLGAQGAGNITITGGSGADTINLSTTALGIDNIAPGSVISAIDTIVNFKIAGADVFKTGTAATSLNALNIATADTATFAAAIATAATAAGAALASNTQAYLITVSAGTAAGVYAFQNIGGTTGTVDATDFIVKIVGAGSIVAGDFVA
ncbi:beta strand repeat-containing protein, partial [Undibacterium sp. Ji49W]|uniref:beta strand repeat-containing protein n=1 Tax=Undibacterium sp. Ji49W TaxID=3413040 RepID=UPI003BF117C6